MPINGSWLVEPLFPEFFTTTPNAPYETVDVNVSLYQLLSQLVYAPSAGADFHGLQKQKSRILPVLPNYPSLVVFCDDSLPAPPTI